MIECNNLVLGYKQALNQSFSLKISENKWLGVIGENGSGKSTLFKTILGNLKPLAGTITILRTAAGTDNSFISYIPQEREINLSDKMSALSLIYNSFNGWHFGLPIISTKNKQAIKAVIELVGAEQYINQEFNTLSGGQKKRIYLAQALINQPKFLLLDEPLADLDPNAREHFIIALAKIHQQKKLGLMIISHDMHEIAHYLDGFIHFKQHKIHYCDELPCIREDSYVGI